MRIRGLRSPLCLGFRLPCGGWCFACPEPDARTVLRGSDKLNSRFLKYLLQIVEGLRPARRDIVKLFEPFDCLSVYAGEFRCPLGRPSQKAAGSLDGPGQVIDLMASEAADRAREEGRLIAIAGKDAITVSFGDWALENVPLGQFADRFLAWIETPGRTPSEVRRWAEGNRDPLRTFWAKSPSDALELKKVIEAKSRETAEGEETRDDEETPPRRSQPTTPPPSGTRASRALPTRCTPPDQAGLSHPREPDMRGYQIQRPGTAFTAKSRLRRPRQRSDLHLKWIRTLPCAICGKQGGIHAAHLRAGSSRHGKLATGIGQKPDDSWTTIARSLRCCAGLAGSSMTSGSSGSGDARG